MKRIYLLKVAAGLLFFQSILGAADISVGFSYGDPLRAPEHYRHPYYSRPYRDNRNERALRGQPYFIETPYYAGYSYPVSPVYAVPTTPVLSGDYGSDLAALNERLSRLRTILARQKENRALRAESYDRLMATLEGIEHDEHDHAYRQGGNLSPVDFADLFHRLDDAAQDLEIALAE